MQTIIVARVKAIRQAHANNLISNMDMGVDVLEGMLRRAHEPISNEEFTRREEDLLLQRHRVIASAPMPIDKQQDLPLDAADEIADTLMRSMIRLSTDEERRKKIGMMLV